MGTDNPSMVIRKANSPFHRKILFSVIILAVAWLKLTLIGDFIGLPANTIIDTPDVAAN